MSVWGGIIQDLMAETGVSQRGMSMKGRFNRSTLRKFLAGEATASVAQLEAYLNFFGYSLEVMPASAGFPPARIAADKERQEAAAKARRAKDRKKDHALAAALSARRAKTAATKRANRRRKHLEAIAKNRTEPLNLTFYREGQQ